MGLSSSQARLLSITARLTDNEYKSQRITNAKMQLSNLGFDAQKNYSDALQSQKLEYINYNNASTREDLTPAIVYQYQPYKNQYALTNTANQILVSRTDAINFEETNNLAEFLDRYDLLEEKVIRTKKQPREVTEANPNYAQYLIDLENWRNREPDQYIMTTIPAWTERVHDSDWYNIALNTKDMAEALAGNTNAFVNVLASWLGPGYHETSKGDGFYITLNTDETTSDYWNWNTAHDDLSEILTENLKFIEPCNDNDHYENVDINYNGEIYRDIRTKSWSCDSSFWENVTSAGCDDTSKEYSVHQKIVDFLWYVAQEQAGYSDGEVNGGSLSSEIFLQEFFHILEFDLDNVTTVEHPEETTLTENPDYIKWLSEKPVEEPEFITYTVYDDIDVNTTVVNDKEKAQWYTNLWYRMNGNDDPAKIHIKEYTNELDEVSYYNALDFYAREKNTSAKNYVILDSKLVQSKEWLYDALKEGIITMERINYSNSSKTKELGWESIIYTNATDITETDDEEKVARAEVEYESVMETIDTKDKKFQMELKQLDAEHHALLTEYESVRAAMEKNVDRSFKAFQG